MAQFVAAVNGDIVSDDPTANGPEFPTISVINNFDVFAVGIRLANVGARVGPHDALLGAQHTSSNFGKGSTSVFCNKRGVLRSKEISRCGDFIIINQNFTVFVS